MKKVSILLFLVLLVLVGCSNSNVKNSTNDSVTPEVPAVSKTNMSDYYVNVDTNKDLVEQAKIIFEKTEYTPENLANENSINVNTISSFKDSKYNKNLINEKSLSQALSDEMTGYIYFFSPTCSYCISTTPIIQPVAEKYNVQLGMFNLLEQPMWELYKINGTPTLVYYEKGQEVDRLVGQESTETYEAFFEKYKETK